MKCPKCNSKMKGSRVRGTFFVRVYNCRCGFVSDFAQVTPDVSRFSKIVGSMSLHNVEWRFSHLHSPRLPIPHLPYTVLAVIFLVFLSFSSEYANTLYGIPVVFSISKQTVSSLSKYSVRCALPSCRKRLSRNHQLISNMIEQNGQRLYFCKEQHLSYYKNPELVKLVSDSKRSFLKKFTLGAGLLSLSSLLLGRNLGLQEAPASITPPIQYGQWSLLAPVSWIIFNDGTHMYAKSGVTGAIGTIVYGGPSNAGGTSGTDVNAILNSMVTNIASNEGIQSSLGVTIAFLPGEYGGVGTNTVYLPNSGSPHLGLEITLRGSGKSITRLLGTRFV